MAVAAFCVAPRTAYAQQWRCYPFLRGETAGAAASRLAGDAGAFEILDLSTSRFVAKNQYGRIRSGWVACTWVTQSIPAKLGRSMIAAPIDAVKPNAASQRVWGVWPDPLWCLLVLMLVTPWGAYEVNRRWKLRRAVIGVMTQLGNSVIQEFERPLVQPRDARPALQSRLRLQPLRNRFQVLLAPVAGRSYPNLSDHKKNVEYDMERVHQTLGDTPYVNDSMRQRGEWVVFDFRARVQQEKAGVM